MTQEELINKRGGFEADPGVVVSGPYQVLHHTSPKFMYDEAIVASNDNEEEENEINPNS